MSLCKLCRSTYRSASSTKFYPLTSYRFEQCIEGQQRTTSAGRIADQPNAIPSTQGPGYHYAPEKLDAGPLPAP
ncbi:hmg-box dna-binding protein [Moniliophthora roreri]|nr:hmg-box dna-binding protein [Moniliophthora roreri]